MNKNTSYIGSNHHLHTEDGGHDDCVKQRITNDNIPIIRHCCKKAALSETQARKEEVLHGAPHKGDGFILPEEV
jgi:hypothetical protein